MSNPIFSRRDTLASAAAAIALSAVACRDPGEARERPRAKPRRAPAPTPTPTIAATTIGLFADAAASPIATGTTVVRTTGWAHQGKGGAFYREDPTFVPALYPRAGFRSADGRSFRLHDDQPFQVEMFGAVGDLVLDAKGNVASGTNDTAAFAAASGWIERAGGGTLHCAPKASYLVGEQRRRGKLRTSPRTTSIFAWAGQPIIQVWNARKPVVIEGHGAMLKAAPGYRYGVFDAKTGAPKPTKAPLLSPDIEIGFPYFGIIDLQNCTGGFVIRDLRLDGSANRVILGGEHGDLGRQVNGCGIFTLGNRGPVLVENVETHHHPWDGWLFNHLGPVAGTGRPTVSHFHGHHNGRQAMSLTGGTGGSVVDSRFVLSARDLDFASSPAAGVDIEPEGSQVHDWSFLRCRFGGSAGVALLSSVNGATNLRFDHCDIHGAYEIALWPGMAGMVFRDCLVTGMTTAVHPGTDFVRCRFTDDPKLSPFGKVHAPSSQILVTLSNAVGVSLDACTIERRGPGMALYCDQQTARLNNCTVRAAGPGGDVVWGRWSGRSSVTIASGGGVNAAFTHTVPGGSLTINGKPV